MAIRALCLSTAVALLLCGHAASAATAPAAASAAALEDCTSRFDTLSAADQLHGMGWDQFRSMICGLPGATVPAAPAPAVTPPAAAAAPALLLPPPALPSPTAAARKAGQPARIGCQNPGQSKRVGKLVLGKVAGACSGGRKG